jgi:orotidine-5'-phosphate decarboxylase
MTRQELIAQIKAKRSFLCIGLDTDLDKIPSAFQTLDDPLFEFNKAIVDATADLCVAYKPNLAFFESYGEKGWESLRRIVKYIGNTHFVIADAKRGDIGNTSERYAKAFFENLGCDSITLSPYMGSDSIKPFLNFPGKWAILLALTSNAGADDFELLETRSGKKVFEQVLETSLTWGSDSSMMYVVGATRPEQFTQVRKIVPNHFLLVPGVGAQGGSLKQVCEFGLIPDIGLLINASRSILYASAGPDFAQKARAEARKLQNEMEEILSSKGIV